LRRPDCPQNTFNHANGFPGRLKFFGIKRNGAEIVVNSVEYVSGREIMGSIAFE
jgi:hypothetical protein